MLTVLNVIAPVFAIVVTGFVAVRLKVYPGAATPGLIKFVNNFATPCLLFRAMLQADFAATFNPLIIGAFYTGALIVFVIGIYFARRIFANAPGVAVAAAFGGMFSTWSCSGYPSSSAPTANPRCK